MKEELSAMLPLLDAIEAALANVEKLCYQSYCYFLTKGLLSCDKHCEVLECC